MVVPALTLSVVLGGCDIPSPGLGVEQVWSGHRDWHRALLGILQSALYPNIDLQID